MKPLSQMNHYEVLELPPGASAEEVERAYRMAQSTYAADSLASYSVFDPQELNAIRERVELAYRVLTDVDTRVAYDGRLPGDRGLDEEIELPLAFSELELEAAAPRPRSEVPPEIEEFADFESEEDGPYDGGRLRRARLACGFDLEKIALVTKISAAYLECIEEEKFPELPADVYVRGFVAAYARCVGVDPERAAHSYMQRVQDARPAPRPRHAHKPAWRRWR